MPVQIGPLSTWLYDDQNNLTTVYPTELSVHTFWDWIREEAVRAAGLWLIDYPYAPAVVLETYPDEDHEWQLARFTSLPAEDNLISPRGRPVGSGVFENREAFLGEIRMAVAHLNLQGNRVTQKGVAKALFQSALLGSDSAERQFRRWVRGFGFASWKDLLNHL